MLNEIKPIRVALVEDNIMAQEKVLESIRSDKRLQLLGVSETKAGALQMLESITPDVLLCDLGLPDGSGVDVVRYCAQHHPQCLSMVITLYENSELVLDSFAAGAQGYLLKDSSEEGIASKVIELVDGGAPMTPVIARMVLQRMQSGLSVTPAASPSASLANTDTTTAAMDNGDASRHHGQSLTKKETTVLKRIAQGFSYAETASLENVAVTTVASHIRSVYAKLGVHSKTEAVYEASRLGLLKQPV